MTVNMKKYSAGAFAVLLLLACGGCVRNETEEISDVKPVNSEVLEAADEIGATNSEESVITEAWTDSMIVGSWVVCEAYVDGVLFNKDQLNTITDPYEVCCAFFEEDKTAVILAGNSKYYGKWNLSGSDLLFKTDDTYITLSLKDEYIIIGSEGSDSKKLERYSEIPMNPIGTWDVLSMRIEGVDFSKDQLIALWGESYSDEYFKPMIFDELGNVVMPSESDDTTDWNMKKDGVQLGETVLSFELLDGRITFSIDVDGSLVRYGKVDKNTDIPEAKIVLEENVEENVEENISENVNSAEGIRPEFKEALDEYEAFFDYYVEFIKTYSESGSPVSMLAEYLEVFEQYTNTMQKLDEIGNEEMTTEETLYYSEVMLRIQKKLLEAYGE